MGLGNFIKRTARIGKLPEAQINSRTVISKLNTGVPFEVTLPLLELRGGNTTYTVIQGGIASTFGPIRYKENRKVKTLVQCNAQQIIVTHALEDGSHYAINFSDVARIGKVSNGILVEHRDGRQIKFELNRHMRSEWKTLGFNPQFVIEVFYRLILDKARTLAPTRYYESEIIAPQQTNLKINNISQKKSKKHEKTFQEKIDEMYKESNSKLASILEIPCPICGKMIKANSIKCKYCSCILKKYKMSSEYKKQVEKAKLKLNLEGGFIEDATINDMKLNDNKMSADDEKSFNDLFNIGKINSRDDSPNNIKIIPEETEETTAEMASEETEEDEIQVETEETNNLDGNIFEDISFKKIKEAKELLDIGAITQEEFDEIKSRYLKNF